MTTDLAEYLRVCRADIDAALDAALPASPACPPLIAEAMRYSLMAGGKRFRPILTLAAGDAVDEATGQPSSRASILPIACAIELIHTYSLVHDDLPAMDDDTLRRGRPTAHVVYGDGLAILSGDGLLTEAFGLLARPAPAGAVPAARRLRAIAVIATAAGAAGMVGGQAIDIGAGGTHAADRDRPTPTLDADGLRAMHQRKTGALITAAAVSGAIMAGGDEAIIDAIDRYAGHLGLAFQIVDDILDVEGAADELGKTAGKDAAGGKPTYPALFGLEASRRQAAEAAAHARDALGAAHVTGRLADIGDWIVSRTH